VTLPQTTSATPTISTGARGSAVTHAQFLLRVDGVSVGIDGDFGPETTTAVQNFQREFGLTVDGVVGPVTWAALFAQAPGHRLPPTLQPSSSGPLVAHLQQALNQARSLFAPTAPLLAVDGEFGPLTRTTVQFLQRYGHVGDDGIVGLHTWAISLDSFGQQPVGQRRDLISRADAVQRERPVRIGEPRPPPQPQRAAPGRRPDGFRQPGACGRAVRWFEAAAR